ncbi:(2Fe-2S) ferredoxin domain-containing protein [Rhodopirellula sp. JC639]|uniref:(2Fe-2S) ferredoxin domain-containing protein n=1 Tax=Stieleria mannarensis TaxID=2755585 RepID=UPI001601B986|nr:(2Fe-2S) ferredoxin domain-containing protein [Rhodopirellula sp. JC639]
MNLSSARKKAAKLKLDKVEHTLVVCMDRKTAKCCSGKAMDAAWNQIKRRVKQRRKEDHAIVLRIKAGCIGVCKGGPIVGVLPDGIWYGDCTPEIIDRIFDEHLAKGSVIRSHVIAEA